MWPCRLLVTSSGPFGDMQGETMIDREPDLRVVGEASSASQAMTMLDRARSRVVLLDLKLTGRSALWPRGTAT